MTTSTNELNSRTQVFGSFSGIEVTFTLGDCVRHELCIKVTNIQKMDKTVPGKIENVVCLSDKRLVLTNINTDDIRLFLRKDNSPKNEPMPETKNTNFQKKPSSTNNKDFRSREARRHVMAH